MTAPLRHSQIRVDPLTAFKARAQGRAILWAACEFDWHEAIDVLQADAVSTGLVERIGQDAVQAIMARAFEGCGVVIFSGGTVSFAESYWSAPGWREAAEEYHAARVPE
jgi:hypothetical protein